MAIGAAIAGAAITAGATIYSSSQQRKAANRQTQALDRQTDAAQRLIDEGAIPRTLTNAYLQRFMEQGTLPFPLTDPDQPGPLGLSRPDMYGLDDFLSSGELPAVVNPSYQDSTAYGRDVLERQFALARDRTLGEAPAQGGRLAQSLTQLESDRALGVTQLYTDQKRREDAERNALRQRLYGLGIDLSREQANQENTLRQQLFNINTGVGYNAVGPALGALASASSGYGALAANTLNPNSAGNQISDLGQTLVGFATPAAARQLQGWNDAANAQQTVDLYRQLYGSQALPTYGLGELSPGTAPGAVDMYQTSVVNPYT